MSSIAKSSTDVGFLSLGETGSYFLDGYIGRSPGAFRKKKVVARWTIRYSGQDLIRLL